MVIRKIKEAEVPEAIQLVLSVFMEFEAPEYSKEGILHFQEFVHKSDISKELELYGAFHRNKIVGVIATRKEGKHISLFFVNSDYHKQGIGRKLFEIVKKNCKGEVLTVNSSPFAVPIYKHLGFMATDTEQIEDGIRFTPMIFHK